MGGKEQVADSDCCGGLPPSPSPPSVTLQQEHGAHSAGPKSQLLYFLLYHPNNSLASLSPNSLLCGMREPYLPHKVVVRME